MSSSFRVSKADIEASRLVFVMLKGAKNGRKLAIPIMEGMSFTAFENQVKAKLRIKGIHSMQLSTTGEDVIDLSQLQDIDQIEVLPIEENALPATSFGPPTGSAYNGGLHSKATPPVSHKDDPNRKYIKRKSGMVQSLIRKVAPGWANRQPSLPVTMRDDGTGRRGRRRAKANSRNLMFVLCALILVLVLSMFYLRAFRAMSPLAQESPDTFGTEKRGEAERDSVGGVGMRSATIHMSSTVKDAEQANDAFRADERSDGVNVGEVHKPTMRAPSRRKPVTSDSQEVDAVS